MAELDEHLDAITSNGFTIVGDVFDAERASATLAEIDGLVQRLAVGVGTNGFEGFATTRVYNLLAHGPAFEAIPVEPRVLAIVRRVLDDECLVSSLSSIDIGPGEAAQPLHADDQVIPLERPHTAVVCNSMWALTDFTEANGATRVVPGSHRLPKPPRYGEEYESIPAEMPAGSVLVWHGSLWHGGGANTTTTRRVGIAMNYCAGWVRQQENQQLGLPGETVARFTDELQRLCGFGVYRGLIGHIDRATPASRLFGDDSPQMLWDTDSRSSDAAGEPRS